MSTTRKTKQTEINGRVIESFEKNPQKDNMLRIHPPKMGEKKRNAFLSLSRNYEILLRDIGFKKLAKNHDKHRDQEREIPIVVSMVEDVLLLQFYNPMFELDTKNKMYNYIVPKIPPTVMDVLMERFSSEFEHDLNIDLQECKREHVPSRGPYQYIMLGFSLDSSCVVGKSQNKIAGWFI